MPVSSGAELLHDVATRIITAHLYADGATRVDSIGEQASELGSGVDLAVLDGGQGRSAKLKADPYYGTDFRSISDRTLTFYRADASSYAFEALANTATRDPGWTLTSDAQDLYYYYLVIAQTAEEIAALMGEPDEIFFSELAVDRDELVVLPMQAVREWFETHHVDYTPRPVINGEVSSWCRLVPRRDVEHAIAGIHRVGPIFGALSR